MELLRLSKFKLQLRTLVTEVRELRERERSVTEQLHCRIQKQKQTEEEYARKLHELQAELSSSNELRQKFERKVNYLQNDNALLENKQKELKETIQNLVLSKELFVNAYDESTSDLKRSIHIRDRKLSFLSEKLKSHLSLFDSIEKEAFSVKQVVDNAQRLMSEKENVVADLKSKLDKVSALEKAFVEKISDLEQKLKYDEDQIQRKDEVIAELEAQLEAATISTACQTQIDDISKILSSKDMAIQNLILEKEALHLELGSFRIIIKKIQDNFANINEEDKAKFSSVLECQEGYNMDLTKHDR
ncbi:protein GRIP [Morus notabilis]|uniref:protein GRIP n=1 Tax=Morus notabilis TaxID=981085 RepID=UPI000CECEDB0|nr:protein GRIP [Morus notabilis]